MADTVKVPLFGNQKKGTVIGVALGGITVSAFIIIHQMKKAKEAQVATDQAAAQAQAASGYGYGSSSYGYGTGQYPTGYYGYGEPGYYGYGFNGAGGGFGVWQTGTVTQQQGQAINTNPEWVKAAVADLKAEGYNPAAVSAALGTYEIGQAVTDSQLPIVRAAIGLEGYPPESGRNGYPPKIRHAHGSGGQGQKGSKKVKVPEVDGDSFGEARKKLIDAGLKVRAVPSGTGIVAYAMPPAGTDVNRGSVVVLHMAGTR